MRDNTWGYTRFHVFRPHFYEAKFEKQFATKLYGWIYACMHMVTIVLVKKFKIKKGNWKLLNQSGVMPPWFSSVNLKLTRMECFKNFSAQCRTQDSSCLSNVFLRKLSMQWPKHLSTNELYILRLQTGKIVCFIKRNIWPIINKVH